MRCEGLLVWHRAMEMTEALARVEVARGNADLAQQMRSAAVSVVSNLAEGAERGGDAEFANFLAIAAGSAAEVQTQVRIGVRIGALRRDRIGEVLGLAQQVGWMLRGLRKAVAQRMEGAD